MIKLDLQPSAPQVKICCVITYVHVFFIQKTLYLYYWLIFILFVINYKILYVVKIVFVVYQTRGWSCFNIHFQNWF
jgi:hypothetical protein